MPEWYVTLNRPHAPGSYTPPSHWVEAPTAGEAIEIWLRQCYPHGIGWDGGGVHAYSTVVPGDWNTPISVVTLKAGSLALLAIIETIRQE